MEINELISAIFQVCILPLLGVLTTFLVKWLQAKSQQLQANAQDETSKKYCSLM